MHEEFEFFKILNNLMEDAQVLIQPRLHPFKSARIISDNTDPNRSEAVLFSGRRENQFSDFSLNREPFGDKYLYKWCKKACNNLGIKGIDLYGGTLDSSATALKEVLTHEQIKAGTMHSTNKAFERYFQRNDAIDVYSLTASGNDKGSPKKF